jgi:hypothetical protein
VSICLTPERIALLTGIKVMELARETTQRSESLSGKNFKSETRFVSKKQQITLPSTKTKRLSEESTSLLVWLLLITDCKWADAV